MSYFIHTANLLYLASYLVRDILWLRALTIVAMVLLLPYYYFSQAAPMYVPIGWNLVFLAINVYQTYLLLLERRPVKLSPREQRLYQLVFRTLTPREFKKLLDIGAWKDADVDARIVEQGQALDSVLLIFEGAADVCVDGKRVATLEDGALIGEMSFLTGESPNASVSTTKSTRYLAWPAEPLREFLGRNPELRAAWQLIVGTDLVGKLKAA